MYLAIICFLLSPITRSLRSAQTRVRKATTILRARRQR